MIRPVLLIAVFFSSTTIASEYTANEVLRFCSDHSKVTEQIMINRQRGMDINYNIDSHIDVSRKSAATNKAVRGVINEAHKQPIQKSDVAKFGVVKRFRDKNMMRCLGNHYALR